MRETMAVVLAAGQGTRMESDLPKVLVPALGRPMIEFVIEALNKAGVGKIVVVVGYRAADVRAALAHHAGLRFVEQTEQKGTGHAVMMCEAELADQDGPVLVVTGDSPLIQADSVRALLDLYAQESPACVLGTLHKDDPRGLGRVVRDDAGQFLAIVEERDATAKQRELTEVNMSTYVFAAEALRTALKGLSCENRQREYYITDCPGILRAAGRDVRALPVLQPCEALSVNNMAELAIVEQEMRKRGMA